MRGGRGGGSDAFCFPTEEVVTGLIGELRKHLKFTSGLCCRGNVTEVCSEGISAIRTLSSRPNNFSEQVLPTSS